MAPHIGVSECAVCMASSWERGWPTVLGEYAGSLHMCDTESLPGADGVMDGKWGVSVPCALRMLVPVCGWGRCARYLVDGLCVCVSDV